MNRRITPLVFVIASLLAAPAVAQTPTARERTDQALMIGSLSMSSVALGITMACTSARQCREVNPWMAKAIAKGPVQASVLKAAANGAATYIAWRTLRGKRRTVALGILCAVNTWDAVHDIREMRKLGAR